MLKGNTTEEKIWNFLLDNIKNEYAVAGVIGNLYAESALKPNNLQNTFEKKLKMTDEEYTSAVDNGTYDNFINDKAGYGLAQWTYYTRKSDLLVFAKENDSSIGDLEMQLKFLIQEFETTFKKMYPSLKNAKSVKAASDLILLQFEKPLDQSNAVKNKRAEFSNTFYNKFKKQSAKTETKKKSQQIETIEIIQSFGINNTNYLANRKLEWIVVHYTAGTSSKGGAALNCAIGARTGGLSTSAEFYVDDTSVVQYIQDIKNRHSWSVGGAKWDKKYTSLSGIYYGKCTNQNSINIEICSNKTNKKSLSGEDTDWYFTESELKLAAALVRKLMHDYGIGLDHVIMHHQVNGKTCPQMWCYNESRLSEWKRFLQMVNGEEVKLITPIANTTPSPARPSSNSNVPYLVIVTAAALSVRDGAGVENKVNTIIKDQGKYTIVEERNGWGRLKSGAGWINLKYTKKV